MWKFHVEIPTRGEQLQWEGSCYRLCMFLAGCWLFEFHERCWH